MLDFLAKFKVFDRCSAAVVLGALKADHFHNGDMLSCRALVRVCTDEDVRSLMLASVDTAELILSKHLLDDSRSGISLPTSPLCPPIAAPCSMRTSTTRNIASPNYVQLIATARVNSALGIDAKLKLKARRADDKFTANLFATNPGMKTGVEVRSPTRRPRTSWPRSKTWSPSSRTAAHGLLANVDYPTILNNFIYVFRMDDAACASCAAVVP